KSPIVITDGNFQIKAAKFKGNWNDAAKDFALFLEECRPLIDEFNLSTSSNMDFSLERYDGRYLHYIMRKINLKSRIGGYIFVCSGTETPSEMSKIIIDHAATVTALELSKHEAIAEQTKITENHFFIDIITGNVKTEEEAKFRANNLQWISLPLSLVVFDVDRFEELSRTKTEKELYDIKERIAGIINVHMYSGDMKSTVLLKSDSFTCLIPHSYTSQMIESSVKIIQKEVLSQFSLGITAGICENVNSYLELGTAYNDARDAICISRREGRENSLVFIKNAKLEQALLTTANNVYFGEYLDLTLNRLIAYDKKNGTQLLETLTQLVECMGVRTAAAEKLFLHRNTLTYKIKKIESIIGCNLSRSEDLLCLGIAIKISRFVDNPPL
ncbi:MAG: helix-turn-helix domain-containing protein, partial [Oscillospiraceae bacterium]